MPPQAFPVFFTSFVVLGLSGVFYAAWRGDKKRNAAMETVARTMGFSYIEKCSDAELGSLAGNMPLFNRGHSRKGKRLLTGRIADRDCHIMDYQYITGGGKSSHTHMQTIVLLDQTGTKLPDFTLSPENVLHRLAEMFGYQDIDFESHPDFSKHYLLRGKDEAAIRQAFTLDVLSLMGATTGWHVEACDGRLAIYREGRFNEPGQTPSYAAEALRVAGAFKT
jgi:hypothetical protein